MTTDSVPAIVQRCVNQVFASHQPMMNYVACSDEEIIEDFISVRCAALQVVVRLTDDAQVARSTVLMRAGSTVYDPAPDALHRLYRAAGGTRPVEFLLRRRLDLEVIAKEIRRRLKRSPVGQRLIATKGKGSGLQALAELLKVLRVDRIRSFSAEEDPEDLQSIASEAALKRFDRLGQETVGAYSPGITVRLPGDLDLPAEGDRWATFWPTFLSKELTRARELLLPILEGKTEALPEVVHQTLRDHWSRRRALKRTGAKVDLEHVDAKTLSTPHDFASRGGLDAIDLYRAAERRWGVKGVRFLNALKQGMSVEEASRVAGISRKTGHKYLRILGLNTPSP